MSAAASPCMLHSAWENRLEERIDHGHESMPGFAWQTRTPLTAREACGSYTSPAFARAKRPARRMS